jgi:Fe-S-cluster containining protein
MLSARRPSVPDPCTRSQSRPDTSAGEDPEAGPSSTWGTATIEFTIGARPVRLAVPIPREPIRARVMLPVFQNLTDRIVQEATEAVERKGAKISCQKGCGACCRQLVPISRMEAYHIRDLVAGLPEPRRTEIRARFAAARRRLQEAGLLEKLQQPERARFEDIAPIGMGYWALQIPCPFLEDEACSIHPDRPLACREYLVTSPAENCARPSETGVQGVRLAGKVSFVIARLDEREASQVLPHVPLILAPEWADAHPDEPDPRPAQDILRQVFERLATKKEVTS